MNPISSASLVLALGLLSLLIAPSSPAETAPSPTPDALSFTKGLVIEPTGQNRRSPFLIDALEAQIVAGNWTPPTEGDAVTLPNGDVRSWQSAVADPTEGGIAAARRGGGYAYWPVTVEKPRVMLLEATGSGMAYVNGEPRAGDVYGSGWVRLPVFLHAGQNDLLFQFGRGKLHAKLTSPEAPILLDSRDSTLPDFVAGEKADTWGAVVLINATTETRQGLSIQAEWPGTRPTRTPLPLIPPLSIRKVGFRLRGAAPKSPGTVAVRLELEDSSSRVKPPPTPITIRVRKPEESRKVTFLSDIDGSVQYYAVVPPHPASIETARPALVLTLHGAGVEAIGQADAYYPKSWAYLVAPTNRRPYGFDWEAWGRLDALEVLNRAQKEYDTDPQRTYLTGHSMGGHGTWQLGVNYPNRFAAIGPSAGWISIYSYAGARREEAPTGPEAMFQRAAAPSDTLALDANYATEGVYILHGSADDNVPVTQAREMADTLSHFHHDYTFFEQPGAGHWWDASDEPGASCVDWPPMFDMFARHRLPAEEDVRQVDFVTANPGVSATLHWATIEAQIHPLQKSAIHLQYAPGLRRFSGTTENVERLAVQVGQIPAGNPLDLELDGQKLEKIPYPAQSHLVRLVREGDRWRLTSEGFEGQKGPGRYGPFKDAFRHHMIFVYGTRGTAEENAWAFAKARYDAETFWYRGNGAVDLLPDTAFDSKHETDRSVILYGNSNTNGAWNSLLADSPVQVSRESVRVGNRDVSGSDLACLFLRPRPGSTVASVGVVAGTGLPGLRLTNRLPYFTTGADFPDWAIVGSESLQNGYGGVRAAGFFGNDWSVERGDSAWAHDKALPSKETSNE